MKFPPPHRGWTSGRLRPPSAPTPMRQRQQPRQDATYRKRKSVQTHEASSQPLIVPASDYSALQGQLREMQRLLGKKTTEAEILREALELAGGQNISCARSQLPRTVSDESGL
jgi:transposase